MKNKILQKNAFTLMEMLIAVAIVVIFLAIGMPFVANQSKSLKMTEMDNYAKTIYLEAQNQLTALKASGVLANLNLTTEGAGKVLSVPADYPAADGESWNNLYYAESTSDMVKRLVPNSASMYDGSFVIEFNPTTGDVYSVFYWENSTIDYDAVADLRHSADRQGSSLGYYGGDIDSTALAPFELVQDFNLINGEELYVNVVYETASYRVLSKDQTALTVKITVKGNTSGAEKVWLFDSDSTNDNAWDKSISEALVQDNANFRFEINLLLDSMISGYSFKDIMAGSTGTFAPGENINVKVESVFSNATYTKSAISEASVNSLFQSADSSTIKIGALRHLYNLDADRYQHSGNKPTILFTDDIDFLAMNYLWAENGTGGCEMVGSARRPLAAFEPIINATLFYGNEYSRTTVNGGSKVLKNFDVKSDVDSVGIFGEATGTIFQNIFVTDVSVEATGTGKNVGTLIGNANSCTFENCGVYLTTTDGEEDYWDVDYEDDVYTNKMDYRYYAELIVSGKENVGGFCGYSYGTKFDGCFAAVRTTGDQNVGGFCGYANSTTMEDCYASGEVSGGSYIGGFLGEAENTTKATNCYATGDLYAGSYAAGFVGSTAASVYNNCYSCGTVLNASGNGTPSDAAGAFASVKGSSGDSFTECYFLLQDSYGVGMSDAAGIGYKYYADMCKNEAGNPFVNGPAFPYNKKLKDKEYPFRLVKDDSNQDIPHYGNWPAQYIIDTSLVYYEKYAVEQADGTTDYEYGYYCVTTLSATSGLGQNKLTWVLDTLQDKICVEDGYGLLTLYYLEKFDYDLYIGSTTTKNETGTLTTVLEEEYFAPEFTEEQRKQSSMILVEGENEVEFTFKGYQGEFTAQTDFTKEIARNTFTIKGMNLYQLPYELQCTDRSGVSNFYDKLVIYNGIDWDTKENNFEEALTFFYCPHFARTAVNPGFHTSDEQMENPEKTYVRSARQLNSIGRYTYYWNKIEGYEQPIYFVQETDICFSTYTSGTKKYCGVEFDLMDTSATNTKRNVVIGKPIYVDRESEGRFNNNYDGNGKVIYDYCLESSEQFVGFFGECEGGIIQNIILSVTEPNKGYIKSTHVGANSCAVGGLLGLSYLTNGTVRNCSISGYVVEYEAPVSNLSGGSNGLYSITVGGLVGISMGDIYNCAATCDVVVDFKTNNVQAFNNAYDGKKSSIAIGGLVGSSYFKTLEDCYSGGTIAISASSPSVIKDLGIGGISGGIMHIWNDVGKNSTYYAGDTTDYSRNSVYKDLYSYTTVSADTDTLSVLTGVSGTVYISPVVNVVVLTTKHQDSASSNGTEIVTDDLNYIMPENVYYLGSSYAYGITKANGTVVRGDNGTNYYNAVKKSHDELRTLALDGMGTVASVNNTFPISEELKAKNAIYPFPAAVTNAATGKYVHYGDWPYTSSDDADDGSDDGGTEDTVTTYPAYFEIYEDGTIGTYYYDADGREHDGLNDNKEIAKDGAGNSQAGYGKLTTEVITGSTPVATYDIGGTTYYLYEDSAITNNTNAVNITYSAEGQTWYINPNFGAAISLNPNLGWSASNPLQVRTAEQLGAVGSVKDTAGTAVYFSQTMDLDLSELDATAVSKLQSGHVYDGNGDQYKMYDAAATVFGEVLGTIKNVSSEGNERVLVDNNGGTVTNCQIEQADIDVTVATAIFVDDNNGLIENCYVKDSSIEAERAAGFAMTNGTNGTIRNCGVIASSDYSDVNIKTKNRYSGQAYGFIEQNGGLIENCFVTGTVSGADQAAGFIGRIQDAAAHTYEIVNCYANCVVTSRSIACGFSNSNGGDDGKLMGCYSAGSVSAQYVYGFMTGNQEKAYSCYSLCSLSGRRETYGFSKTDGSADANCYWGYSGNHNNRVAEWGDGSRVTLLELTTMAGLLTNVGAAGQTADPYTATLGTTYPYPAIAAIQTNCGVAHYGDWPVPSGVRNDTVADKRDRYMGIFYYERYADGSYGIYGNGVSVDWTFNRFENPTIVPGVMNTLATAAEAAMVTDRGYGIFRSEDVRNTNSWYVVDGGTEVELNGYRQLTIGLSGYTFYKVSGDVVDNYSLTLRYKNRGTKNCYFTLSQSVIDAARP